jgi:hypothetical protein
MGLEIQRPKPSRLGPPCVNTVLFMRASKVTDKSTDEFRLKVPGDALVA